MNGTMAVRSGEWRSPPVFRSRRKPPCRDDTPEDDGPEEDEDGDGVAEPLLLGGSERAQLAVGLLGAGVGPEAGHDDLLGDPGGGDRDEECRGGEEVVVRGRADGVGGIHDVRGLLREAGEERVDGAEDEVRAVAT